MLGLETSEAGTVDAHWHALEHEEVVVEPAAEYLERRLRQQLPERRSAGQSWVDGVFGGNSGGHTGFCALQCRATVLLEQQSTGSVRVGTWMTFMELHLRVETLHHKSNPTDRISKVTTGANGKTV